jgi:hypothetical protein
MPTSSPSSGRSGQWFLGIAVLVALGVGAYFLPWRTEPEPFLAPLPPRVEAPTIAPSTEPPPTVHHPIEEARGTTEALVPSPLPSVDKSDPVVQHALVDLLGRERVLSLLAPNEYVRRFVATVDNLARREAAARLWPVLPIGGRLAVEETADGLVLAPKNAQRYERFVNLVESIDTGRAIALYVQLYPLCQRAYQELGFPEKYFNDRLVGVIDHLLATSDVVAPVTLVPPDVQGPYKPARPWVMYRFADPDLESRSAGQKMLIRMGPENARRLKAKLVEIRALLLGTAPRQ